MINSAKDQFSHFKDKSFRPGQRETVQAIIDSKKKVAAVRAPTGSGKSLIGMTTGALHDKFAYLCSSKQLQHQLCEDFPEALTMMGRNNYECNTDPFRTADMCVHSSTIPCKSRYDCTYQTQKKVVVQHPMQILNYHYLLYEANYVGQFTGYPIIICDEADMLEGLITNFVGLRLSRRQLEIMDISPPRYKTTSSPNAITAWQDWANNEAHAKVTERIKRMEMQIKNIDPNVSLTGRQEIALKEYKSLQRLSVMIETFVMHVDKSWLFQADDKTNVWTFKPTWLTPELSEMFFFRHGVRFVLMSATLPPRSVLAHTLGLHTEDVEMIKEMDSPFPIKNRQILLNPVADMAHTTYDVNLPYMLAGITDIVNMHKGVKGLIHTKSFKLANAIMDMNNPRFITHDSFNKDAVLEEFAASTDSVLISPSSTRGVDLPDDQCRFIIIAKAPFEFLGDKLVKGRLYDGTGLGKFWYTSLCAQEVVQASGRGVRHQKDHCVTYVLDKRGTELILNQRNLFPPYWMDAVDIFNPKLQAR